MNIPKEVREAMARAMFVADVRDNDSMEQQRAEVDAALSALGEAGYVVVPVMPTGKMLDAGNANIKYQIEEDPGRSGKVG